MAIKRRFSQAAVIAEDADSVTVFIPTDPNDPAFDDKNGNPVSEIEAFAIMAAAEAGVPVSRDETGHVRIGKKLPIPSEVDAVMGMLKLKTYVKGNNGQQPHPKDVETSELLAGVRHVQNIGNEFEATERFYRDRIRSPLSAIRAWCVFNEGGQRKANEDTGTTSPLWLFRSGRNPFYGKLKDANAEDNDDDTSN